MNRIQVVPGLIVTVRGIRWDAEWEYDCPTAILSPVYKFFEDGSTLEYAMESVLLDACIDKTWPGDQLNYWDWRGWTKGYLWRKFYRKTGYTQKIKQRVRFILDEDGELSWEEVASA